MCHLGAKQTTCSANQQTWFLQKSLKHKILKVYLSCWLKTGGSVLPQCFAENLKYVKCWMLAKYILIMHRSFKWRFTITVKQTLNSNEHSWGKKMFKGDANNSQFYFLWSGSSNLTHWCQFLGYTWDDQWLTLFKKFIFFPDLQVCRIFYAFVITVGGVMNII